MLRALKAESEQREADEKTKSLEQKMAYGKDAGKITIPAVFPLSRAWDLEHACQVEITRPRACEVEAEQSLHTYMVFVFLRESRWVPTLGSSNGTSWIELFASFHLMGGRMGKPKDFEFDDSEMGQQLIPAFRLFKRTFLRITHTWMHP